MVLVAKWYERWVRVVVEEPDPLGDCTLVRMVDYGGFYTFAHCQMRKIKYEFLTLPFQALEVFLANIQPKEGIFFFVVKRTITSTYEKCLYS